MYYFKVFFTAIILMVGFLISAKAQETKPASYSKTFNYKIIPAANNTWGYDIYNAEKLLIHQPNRPAIEGKVGFETKRQAIVIAEIVITKLKKGQMPPAVTIEEMKKAGAL